MMLLADLRRSLWRTKERVADTLKPVAPRLRAGFASLSERFSKHGARRLYSHAGSAREGAPPDPARILFPDYGPDHARDGEAEARPGSLSDSLQASARHIVDRQAKLGDRARALSRALADRLDGEATLIAQGFRILIAVVWMVFAFLIAWSHVTGDASWTAFVGPIAAADAPKLAEAFAILAAAGVGVALLRAFIVFALGKGGNNALRARSAELGDEAADIALEFDSELDRSRRAMDGRQNNPADAVQDLSRAHLTALEAAVFFRSLQFLTDSDRGEAALKFRGYLRSHARSGRSGAGLPLFLLGFFFGAAYISSLYPAPPELLKDAPVLAIANYPWALLLILGGAFLYALAGLVVENFAGFFTGPAERQARDEALDAVRSGFVARNAPRIESVIQRIVDALDVYRARVATARRGGDSHGHSTAETPSWRRGPEAPRFVETPFGAAPASWRVDPHLDSESAVTRRPAEIFSTGEKRSETAPKRGLFALKKTPETPSGS